MKSFSSISLPDISEAILPMGFPTKRRNLPETGHVLVADIGGTKTNLALFQIQDRKLNSVKTHRYPTSSHSSFIEAIKDFLGNRTSEIDGVCLAVAGAIKDNRVLGTNFGWEIDGQKIKSDLGVKTVSLINDLEANAYGLASLEGSDYEIVYEGEKNKGNAAVISPGTGLGEAGLYWDGNSFFPYATEGGHCSFSPVNELDFELLKFLQKEYNHVSWERLVSGMGIVNIYDFLKEHQDFKESKELTERFENEDKAAVISTLAREKKNSIFEETIQLFLKYLAREASQIALKTKATGGVFIGGGIVPKILDMLDKKIFYEHFINVGRMESLLKTIPIKIILNDKAALMGAAYFAAMEIEE